MRSEILTVLYSSNQYDAAINAELQRRGLEHGTHGTNGTARESCAGIIEDPASSHPGAYPVPWTGEGP